MYLKIEAGDTDINLSRLEQLEQFWTVICHRCWAIRLLNHFSFDKKISR